MRILVVEDEPDLLTGIVRALRHEGYAVDAAADGNEGLFKAGSPDALNTVSDVRAAYALAVDSYTAGQYEKAESVFQRVAGTYPVLPRRCRPGFHGGHLRLQRLALRE